VSPQAAPPAAPQGAKAAQPAPAVADQALPEATNGAAQPAAPGPAAAAVAKAAAPDADASKPVQVPAAKPAADGDALATASRPAADAPVAQPKGAVQHPAGVDSAAPAAQPAKPQTQTPAPAPDQQAKPDVQATQQPAPPAHSAEPDQPAASAPQQAPQPAAPPLAAAPQATVAQAAPAAEPENVAGMRLHQAVETVYAVIRMSQSSGITQARVQLHPAELGQVDIHLRQTPDGIVAKVVADASQAANVLRHAGDELRRALQAQGLNLTHFDVGTASEDERRSAFAGGDGRPQRRGGRSAADAVASIAATETSTEETTIRLPNGVLVDVLA
jgi:flagellar hook-length control protein FliK